MTRTSTFILLFAALVPFTLAAQHAADSTRSTTDTSMSHLLMVPTQAAFPSGEASGSPDPAPQVELPSALRGLKVGTKTYIKYEYLGTDDDGLTDGTSHFNLKRGYIDIRKTITDYMSFRITPDVHQDDSGDWKVRIKYLHAKFTAEGNDVFNKPYAEVGIAHMPWLDFEEHINLFRMQGTMFMERNSLFNSADLGVMFGANLGSELPEGYRDNVNSHYAGRWGSFQLGVFNGGGYHAENQNNRMALQGRLTLRPLPDVAPGLQFSVLGMTGKGNTAEGPDWNVFNGMVSYESPFFNATGQYYSGTGNQKGTFVNGLGASNDQKGYSAFAELRVPDHKEYSVFSRYDRFDTDTSDDATDVRKRFILGFAWQFFKGNYWVVAYDRLQHSLAGVPSTYSLEVTLQMVY